MRTAIVFTGRVNRLEEDAQSVISNLIEPYQADVFMSVWKPDTECLRRMVSLYKPKALELEDMDAPHVREVLNSVPRKVHDYHGSIRTETNRPNVWMMFYRIAKGNELREEYERANGFTYDCVIRFRFEIGITQPCAVISPEPSTIYIPDGQDHGGVCDVMSIGDSASMNHYASIFHSLNEYASKCMPTHPESVTRKHLELNGVTIKRFRLGTTLRGKPWNSGY